MGGLTDSRARVDGLVDREGELAALEAAFAEVSAGRSRLVLVTAEAGGGKTALIERFCADERAMKARHAAITKFGSNSNSPAGVVEAASDGFHWADAGVGAAGGFALALLLGAALLLSQRQSRRRLAL